MAAGARDPRGQRTRRSGCARPRLRSRPKSPRAGIYQMYLPRSMGGPETPPLTAFRVVEELSKADGSVGWCAMIATALVLERRPAAGRGRAGNGRALPPTTVAPDQLGRAAGRGRCQAAIA